MNKQRWPLLLGAAGWFCAIYWLAERGTFVSPNKPPVAVGLAFTVPILLFLVTERTLPGWRARVTSVSPVLLISMNGWRFIGLGFLMANVEGLPPGGFAWPAGLGDIIMAVTAARVPILAKSRTGKGTTSELALSQVEGCRVRASSNR